MASEVDQLVVKIAGDARALQEALKRAEKSVDNFATKVGKKMQKEEISHLIQFIQI